MAERNDALWIDYTNWRGERGIRRIRPCDLTWGSNRYHREPQWLLRAWDVEKQAMREFAFADIHRISREPFASTVQEVPLTDEQRKLLTVSRDVSIPGASGVNPSRGGEA